MTKREQTGLLVSLENFCFDNEPLTHYTASTTPKKKTLERAVAMVTPKSTNGWYVFELSAAETLIQPLANPQIPRSLWTSIPNK